MTRIRLQARGPLRGVMQVPGDLRIGQEALLWAALAESPSTITGLAARPDHELLTQALRAMGVPIAWTPQGVHVSGVGLRGLKLPRGALQAGSSRSTLEILTALLSAQEFGTRVEATGEAAAHALRTLIAPLRARGAHVAGRIAEDGDVLPPVSVAPLLAGEQLSEAEIEIPDGDPATKFGLLLSGLYVPGATVISEGLLSRDHTERALMALGAGIQTIGTMTMLDRGDKPGSWPGFAWRVPGDFSLACFLIAAALALPGSDVRIEGVALNRSRTAFLDVLRHAGAQVDIVPKGDVAGDEPLGDIRVRSTRLRGVRIAGELAFRLADDVTALAALAPSLTGRLSLRDLASARRRRPDPLRASVQLLRESGFECTEYEDGFDVDPPRAALALPALPQAAGAELALLYVVLGLASGGETSLDRPGVLDALYPGLADTLAALGASIAREESP